MSSHRIKATLHALGMQEYESVFEEHELEDELVASCINDADKLRFLDEVIPKIGRRLKFIEQFKKTAVVSRLSSSSEQVQDEQFSPPPPPLPPKQEKRRSDGVYHNLPSPVPVPHIKLISPLTLDPPSIPSKWRPPPTPDSPLSPSSPLNPFHSKPATDAISIFKTFCQQKLDENEDYMDEETLQKIFNLATQKAFHLLDLSAISSDPLKLESEQTGLRYLIANKITKFTKKNNSRKDQEEKRLKNHVTLLLDSYTTKMKEQTHDLILTDSHLHSLHKSITSEILEEFRSKRSNSLLFTPHFHQLSEELDKKVSKFLTKNSKRRVDFEQKAHLFLGRCKEEYVGKLKKLVSDSFDMADLAENNKKIMTEGIKSIRDYLLGYQGNPGLLPELTINLDEYMVTTFVDYQTFFEMNLEEDELKVKTALMEITNFYNEEMTKHFKSHEFIQPAKLFYLSEQIKQSSLERPNVGLSKNQKKKLEDAIDQLYLKFEEENVLRSPSDDCAIGIDLGTTFSCVGVWINGKVVIVENEDGNKVTPSYVAFLKSEDGDCLVGEAAKDQSDRDPQNTIFDAKRLIGRKWSDPVVQRDIKLWPFDVIPDENDQPRVRIGEKSYPPQEISARVLKHMKDIAVNYLKRDVVDAVITVPANFNDAQRQATREAGEIAGLNVLKILNEPTAAAIAYNLHASDRVKRNVLIFDLGGGTFDVAILAMNRGDIQVKCVRGDTHLGGEDFDNALVDYCISYMKTAQKIDLERDRHSPNLEKKMDCLTRLRRVRNECEKRKRNLSQTNVIEIEAKLDVIDRTVEGKPIHLEVPIERQTFEQINDHSFQKCLTIVKEALDEAKLVKTDIHDIVLVGGSSRIPKVQHLLSEFFDRKVLSKDVNPDEAVAAGAAIQAALLKKKQGVFSVDGSILSLTDVATHSIGIRLTSKKMDVIIPKNSVLPFSNTKPYQTVRDDQTEVVIKIFEGEKTVADENRLLGKFVLSNIPKGKRGKESVDVTMFMTDEGILKVTAICRSNQNTNNFKVVADTGRLSEEEKAKAREAMRVRGRVAVNKSRPFSFLDMFRKT